MDAVQDPAAGSLSRSRIVPPQVPAEYSPRDPQPAGSQSPFTRSDVFRTCRLRQDLRARRPGQERTAQAAWLSLAEEDDDPARFCRQLIEALGEAVPQLGDDAQTYLQNTMRVPVVAVIESLLGDLDRYARRCWCWTTCTWLATRTSSRPQSPGAVRTARAGPGPGHARSRR